jgi:hypothetical protein
VAQQVIIPALSCISAKVIFSKRDLAIVMRSDQHGEKPEADSCPRRFFITTLIPFFLFFPECWAKEIGL